MRIRTDLAIYQLFVVVSYKIINENEHAKFVVRVMIREKRVS